MRAMSKTYRELVQEVTQKKNQFLADHGKPATLVSFTSEEEFALSIATHAEIGNKVEIVAVEGPREAFKKFLGLKITWGSSSFDVAAAPSGGSVGTSVPR